MEYVIADTYCKAGGAGMGYHKAGFKVIGVDIEPQPNYPFEFIQSDALEFIEKHRKDFDAWHASPSCQGYSRTKSLHSNYYPKQIPEVRKALQKTGKPFVIENVVGAPLLNPIKLDGTMFGLQVIRKRLFESNIILFQHEKGIKIGSVGGKDCTRKNFKGYYIVSGHHMGTLEEWKKAMGIDWNIKRSEIVEAIPPQYTEYIGKQLIDYLIQTKS